MLLDLALQSLLHRQSPRMRCFSGCPALSESALISSPYLPQKMDRACLKALRMPFSALIVLIRFLVFLILISQVQANLMFEFHFVFSQVQASALVYGLVAAVSTYIAVSVRREEREIFRRRFQRVKRKILTFTKQYHDRSITP
jgi:uncharacterized integral membrane protein